MAKGNLPPAAKEFETLPLVSGIFSLSLPPSIEHRFNPQTGREFLGVSEDTEYPRRVKAGSVMSGLVLRNVSGRVNVFALPPTFMSVQHVLNEASGVVAIDSQDRMDGKGVFDTVFSKMGATLGELASKERLAPVKLDYRRVIIEETDDGVEARILPPASFAEVTSRLEQISAVEAMAADLSRDLFASASDESQRTLVAIGINSFNSSASNVVRGR